MAVKYFDWGAEVYAALSQQNAYGGCGWHATLTGVSLYNVLTFARRSPAR